MGKSELGLCGASDLMSFVINLGLTEFIFNTYLEC